jgi:hypothetical protein
MMSVLSVKCCPNISVKLSSVLRVDVNLIYHTVICPVIVMLYILNKVEVIDVHKVLYLN